MYICGFIVKPPLKGEGWVFLTTAPLSKEDLVKSSGLAVIHGQSNHTECKAHPRIATGLWSGDGPELVPHQNHK